MPSPSSIAFPYPVTAAPAQTSMGGQVYTTWPGGVDPTGQNYSFGVRPFFTSSGGARRRTRNTRRSRNMKRRRSTRRRA